MKHIDRLGLIAISLLLTLLGADKLIYSAQTRSVDQASPRSLATEFSDKIFEDMSKQGVIK